MDIRQFIARWQQAFSTFEWNTQSVAILMLLLIAAFGAFTMKRPVTVASYDSLFEGRLLAPSELQRIEAAFGKADLTQYTVSGGTIRVPTRLRSKYFAVLQDANCLPSAFHGPTSSALKATSTFETSRTSQQRMHHAHEQEARLAICELAGVLDAFVFFDEKTDRTLQQNRHVTAVVGVNTARDEPLDLQTYRVIRDMLLGFKVDLTPENITITDLTARRAFRGSLDLMETVGIQSLAQQGLEQAWKKRIVDALQFLPEASVNVRVVAKPDSMEADSVRASIGIPSSYLAGLAAQSSGSIELLAEQTRERIKTILQPLLPESNQSTNNLVTVSFVDVPSTPTVSPTTTFANNTMAWLLVGACVFSGIFLYNVVGKPRAIVSHSATDLRVVGTDISTAREETFEEDTKPHEPAAKLRAYVAEDPEAAAKSLSDFIDRAG